MDEQKLENYKELKNIYETVIKNTKDECTKKFYEVLLKNLEKKIKGEKD